VTTAVRVGGAAVVALLHAAAAAGQTGAYKFARVAAVGDGAVTIDAGSADGVRQWTRLEIVRGGRAVAILKVATLADRQTTCAITSRPVPLRVGDYARYLPSGSPTAAVAVAPAPPVPGPPPAGRPDSSIAGRPRPAAPAPTGGPVRPSTRIVTPAPGRALDSSLTIASPAAPVAVARDTAHPAVTARPAPPVVSPAVTTARPPDTTANRRPSVAVERPPVVTPAPASPVTAAPKPVTPTTAAPATSRPAPAPVPTAPAAVQAPPPTSGAPAPQTVAPIGPGARTARVTFTTTSSAYVSAGKLDGLVEGSRVDVIRRGRSVAELKVSFVSTHQAACQIVSMVDSVVVGDSARYLPVAGAEPVAQRAAGPTPAVRQVSQRQGSSTGRLRGRVGLYYLTVIQRDSLGGRFAQPSGDFRLSGMGLGGSPLGLALDLRTRHSTRALTGTATSTTDQTRVYQAQVFWQAPGSGFRFTTGRQYAPGITSVGLLDGASVEIAQSGWDYGVFGGLQPDLVNLGFSSDISQLGGFVRRHNRPGSQQHWSFTAGGTGSYVMNHPANSGSTNREFLYLQTNYQSRLISLYAVQEVDYYRPWRRVAGEKAISPTSSFANLQLQLTRGVSVTAGVDNRRSVRLYHDVVDSTAAAIFDEAFRRGVWAGFALSTPRHFRASADVRTNHDATTGTANTYTVALGVERLTSLGISLRSRSTRYTTGGAAAIGPRKGWLNSVSLGFEPFGRGSVALTSGWRSERDTSATTLDIRWLSADMDVSLGRSLFAIVSAYRETGGIEAHDLLYAGLSFRF
jgi:hypothetical protein